MGLGAKLRNKDRNKYLTPKNLTPNLKFNYLGELLYLTFSPTLSPDSANLIRPWMVKIYIEREDLENRECSGSLLNK